MFSLILPTYSINSPLSPTTPERKIFPIKMEATWSPYSSDIV